MVSFIIILLLLYFAIGIVLGAVAGAVTVIALKADPLGLSLLTGAIVMWVVLLWWGPILGVVVWQK